MGSAVRDEKMYPQSLPLHTRVALGCTMRHCGHFLYCFCGLVDRQSIESPPSAPASTSTSIEAAAALASVSALALTASASAYWYASFA